MALIEEQITELISLGFNRWTRGNIDRLYISAAQLGLVCSYRYSGSINYAEFNGYTISNNQARMMMGAKTFIDIKTGSIFSGHDYLKERVEEIVAPILT